MPDAYADLDLTDDKLDELEHECIHEPARWNPKHVLSLVRELKRTRKALSTVTSVLDALREGLPVVDLVEGIVEAQRGDGIVLTTEQIERWAATGEWPWQNG